MLCVSYCPTILVITYAKVKGEALVNASLHSVERNNQDMPDQF
jgi:hypothetical protein